MVQADFYYNLSDEDAYENPEDSINEANELEYDLKNQITNNTSYAVYVQACQPVYQNYWKGIIAKGLIVIADVQRDNGPHGSDVILATYRHRYAKIPLRHILVDSVIEEETQEFYISRIVPAKGYRGCVLERGSAEYEGLLGTPIGRLVTFILLGFFGPGHCQIERVVVYGRRLNLRFDIVNYNGDGSSGYPN